MKDVQCQHVPLAAWYAFRTTILTESPRNQARVSYIKRNTFDDGIGKLRVQSIAFPQVCRSLRQRGPSSDASSEFAAKVASSGACWDYQRARQNTAQVIYSFLRHHVGRLQPRELHLQTYQGQCRDHINPSHHGPCHPDEKNFTKSNRSAQNHRG
jgi:hypothetical protein